MYADRLSVREQGEYKDMTTEKQGKEGRGKKVVAWITEGYEPSIYVCLCEGPISTWPNYPHGLVEESDLAD